MSEKIIKIINIQRKLINLASITDDELEFNLKNILEIDLGKFNYLKSAINEFKAISTRVQGTAFSLLIGGDIHTLQSILLRNLFNDEVFIPIITERGKISDLDNNKNKFRTKLNKRIVAIQSPKGNQIYVAPEESITIIEINIENDNQGLTILKDYLGCIPYIGFNNYIQNGMYTPQMLTSLYHIHPLFVTKTFLISDYANIIQKIKNIAEYYIGGYSIHTIMNQLYIPNTNEKSIFSNIISKKIEYNTWHSSQTLNKLKKFILLTIPLISSNVWIFDLNILYELYHINALDLNYYQF